MSQIFPTISGRVTLYESLESVLPPVLEPTMYNIKNQSETHCQPKLYEILTLNIFPSFQIDDHSPVLCRVSEELLSQL